MFSSVAAQPQTTGVTLGDPSGATQVGAVPPTDSRSEDRGSYENKVVASFPHYVPQQTVSGVIRIAGHGSAKIAWMRQLIVLWEQDFRQFQPGVKLEYDMYGTSSAIPALFTGVADIAILGEEIDPAAVRTFERVKHYPPLGIDIFTGASTSGTSTTRRCSS
jgi:phosphate transport system substrate-binding protein